MENLTTQLGELFSAIQRSDVHQVRRLLSARVSPNQCNADGKTALMVASSIGNPTIIQMLCTAAATHKPPEQIFLETGITAPARQTQSSSTLLSPDLDSYPPAAVLANAKQPANSDYLAILSQPKPELPLPDYAATLSTLTDRTLIDSVLRSAPVSQPPALSPQRLGTVVETSATAPSKTVAEGLMNLATQGLRSLTGQRQPATKRPFHPSQTVPQSASPTHQSAIGIPPVPPPVENPIATPIETVDLDAAPISATPATRATEVNNTKNNTKRNAPLQAPKIAPDQTQPSESQLPDIEALALEALLHGNVSQLPEILPEIASDQTAPQQHASNHDPITEGHRPDDLEFTDTFAGIESSIRPASQPSQRQNPPSLRTPIPISKTSTPDVANANDLGSDFLAHTPHIASPNASSGSHAEPADLASTDLASTPLDPTAQGNQETSGQMLLEVAVKQNDVGAVMSLLKSGVDFRPAAWYDTPVLVTAAAMGHGEIVQILIDQGANVNNGYDHLPLHSAAANGHLGVAQILLNSGAYIHGREENGRTALIVAAANGHLPVVQMLRERGADIHAVSQGETAMTIAAKNGHQAVYDYLRLGRLPQSPNGPQGHRQSRSQSQLPNRYEEQLQALQGQSEDPTRPQSSSGPDDSADTAIRQKLVAALLYAAADGHVPRFRQALADGADVNGLGEDWGSGLIHHLEGALKAEGALKEEPVSEDRRNSRRTPLSVAIQAGHISLIEALLDANADPNKPDETAAGVPTLYPIIAAACSSSAIHRSDIIRLLLLQGALINQTDERGRSALMHAIAAQHLDAIATLLAANADLDLKDIAERSALDYAQATDQPQIIEMVEQAKQRQQQATELLTAITQGNTHQVQQLLTAGVSPNAVAEGMSALDQAAAKGYVAIAQQLIDAGADINGRANTSELNPLLYGAYRGQVEIVKLLISLGADLHAEVDNQFNALSYAYLGQQQKRNAGKPFGSIIHLLKAQGLTHSS